MNVREQLGILRSRIIYYYKPRNRKRLMRFYASFVTEGSLCFDIGAHLGNRSDAWLRLGARVIAVEPQPACIRYLKRHFQPQSAFTLLEAAVGEHSGTLPLHISRLTPTITTLADESWRRSMQDQSSFHVQWDETLEVPVLTLDEMIDKYGVPAFVKIDVEDFELQVLKGLHYPLPALSYEYFTPTIDRALACIEELKRLGTYEYNWSFGESQKMEAPAWISAEEMADILREYTVEDPSGDVYARLVSASEKYRPQTPAQE